MRRLGEDAEREERRGRGRPRLFEDPVRVALVVERRDWERFIGACRAEQAGAQEKLRSLLAEFGQPQAA